MMNYFHRNTSKSQHLRDFSRSQKWGNQSGQALIEYLLMLVIVVMIILALTMAFFKPLNDFVTQLNKTYIQCLLETGELPNLKAEANTVCAEFMPKFQAGNIDIGGGSGGLGGGGSNSSSGTENRSGQSSSSDGNRGSDVAGTGGSANRRSSVIRDGMYSSRGGARSELAGGKTTTISVDQFEAGEGYMSLSSDNGGRLLSRQKKTQVGIGGIIEADRQKAQREQERSRSIAVDSESFTQNKNKKVIVKPPPEKLVEDDVSVKADFGFYFRIFFMVIIILLIVILVISQALQMNNGAGD